MICLPRALQGQAFFVHCISPATSTLACRYRLSRHNVYSFMRHELCPTVMYVVVNHIVYMDILYIQHIFLRALDLFYDISNAYPNERRYHTAPAAHDAAAYNYP